MAHVKLNMSGHLNQHLDAMGFTNPGALDVNLADPELPEKVVEFIRPLVGSGDVVTVALPGLAPLATLVLVAIHGLSGSFPTMQPLINKGTEGFVPAPPVDLQSLRNKTARTAREGVVSL
jgi:hypothetical protein